jgi:hypothetical protein
MAASEFETAVSWYILAVQHNLPDLYDMTSPSSENAGKEYLSVQDSSSEYGDDEEIAQSTQHGTKLTRSGPAQFQGDILDNPNMLWSDDVWTKDKEEEACRRLLLQGKKASAYWKGKYEDQAGTYWHNFYKRNADRFFKDRHYLHVVFPEMLQRSDVEACSEHVLRLLEVGCGVGNAVLPLLELNPNLYVVAMDFAKSAIEILKQHSAVIVEKRLEAHVNDVANDVLPVQSQSMDLVLCMFVMSAIAPRRHGNVFKKLFDVLRPGGKLMFRDYAR